MRDFISRGLAWPFFVGWLILLFQPVFGEEPSDQLIDLRSRVSFNLETPARSGDRWLEVEIPLRSSGSSTRFIDNVRVEFIMATGEPQNLRFYQSEVRIATLQGGQTTNTRFYLPGSVVQRDRFSREPYAWAVRVYVDGQEQELPSRNARASRLNTDQLYQSFLQASRNKAGRHEGVLVPIYQSPFWNNYPNEPVPAFIRRPARSG